MVFTVEKIQKIADDLGQYRYKNRQHISGWKCLNASPQVESEIPADDQNWEDISLDHIWSGIDQYFWIKSQVEIPNSSDEQVLLFDLGLLGNLKHTGIEAQLYINGEMYQGIDAHHKEVFLNQKYNETVIQLALKLWTGLPGRKGDSLDPMLHIFKMADLVSLDKQVDGLYFLVKNGVETVQLLSDDDPRKQKLLNSLDFSLKKLDWSNPGSDEFYNSCYQAKETLEQQLKLQKANKDHYTVNGIGHTHIDLAWLWRVKNTKEKGARSFSTVLKLMDKYPEYTFLASTPQLYDYIKQDYPKLYAQIKAKVAEGRWEPEGAMWVEADCNISSGESLVRQILYGTRFFKKEFGKTSHTLWLPDVFGYSWALPQILKKSGITTFMTTKLSWNEFNRMPHDTFLWKGLDGTKILTHFITTPDPNDSKGPFYYTYNGTMTPETVKGIYKSYQDKDVNSSLLLAYGYGDGGGGTTRDMIENIRAMNQLPGLPKITTNVTGKYFKELHNNIDNALQNGQYVHTWDGELYFEYHRATYTGHADNKKNNRKIEILLRKLELLEVIAMLNNDDWQYPSASLEKSWKLLLKNQFHDIIPGSAIHEVYEDSHKDYQQIYDNLSLLLKELSSKYQTNQNEYSIFNSTAWSVTDLVQISESDSGLFYDESGQQLVSQRIGDSYLVATPTVSPFSSQKIQFVNQPEATSVKHYDEAQVKDNSLKNKFYQIAWNADGQLVEIYDVQDNRQVLAPKELGNALEIFEDRPREYDAWNLDISYKEKKQDLKANKIEVIAQGQLCTIVRFYYQFNQSSLKQDMIVYNNQKRIDFKTHVDWHERQRILKASFYTNVRATEATYQIQYGNVKRPTNWNNSWNMAKFETVGHQWADLSEYGYGIALMNESKYGYDIFDNKMSISLLTGSVSPDKTADIGAHDFTYSLLPHQGSFVDCNVEKEAWLLNDPLTVFQGTDLNKDSLIDISNSDTVFVDAVKKAEDSEDVIVRLHEYAGGSEQISLTPHFKVSSINETNLMEEEEGSLSMDADNTVELSFKPYEIKTLLLKR